MPELLQCPLCGREVKIRPEWLHPMGLPSIQDLIDQEPPALYTVTCNDGEDHKHVVSVSGKTEYEAMERWNTRAGA